MLIRVLLTSSRTREMWWPPQCLLVTCKVSVSIKYHDHPACMCFCMHVALFDCDCKCVCRCLCVFCMHVFVCNYVSVGGYVHTQNTEVGNILMSTAKQEIGNTFTALALRTVFRSQAKSPREPSIACDRVHQGIALYPLCTKQQLGEVCPVPSEDRESAQVVPIRAA